MKLFFISALISFFTVASVQSQTTKPVNSKNGKKISPDLFGLFFKDINYAADGGLYAEQVQNRSVQYSPAERKEWNPLSYWEYITPGYSYGAISVETTSPINTNNPHYIVLNAAHIGKEEKYVGPYGVGIKNEGFAGIVVRTGEQYNFSLFAKQLSNTPVTLAISLQNTRGQLLAEQFISNSSNNWQKYTATLTAKGSVHTASLVILATTTGKFALDVISLFPEKTFKNRANGLRADLAQLLADMKPGFIRFPGGCLAHGDGLGNMYRWKNTIGPVEERVEQRSIWGYHQTAGLGYYECFQFCEDIGAKPLPVLPAAVSFQNSGGTWRVAGTGQKAIPINEMQDYLQEVTDLVEWLNGPATSLWEAKRAAAGHPAPFSLQYIGIGNEDKITPEFEERFKMIYKEVKEKHPEITVMGTVGPSSNGDDFEKGWQLAASLKVPVVDEHYYTSPEWFIYNQYRYDGYNRNSPGVYLGEYASWGNKLRNAIAEAAYMTALERNGDIVRLSSYASLLAKNDFTQWKTDMIFFDNVKVSPRPNYYVQKMFSANAGDLYFSNIITQDNEDSALAASCVQDNKTGDIILKLVNFGTVTKPMKVNLSGFTKINGEAEQTTLAGKSDAENNLERPGNIIPVTTRFTAIKIFNYQCSPTSLTVIRIKTLQRPPKHQNQ